MLERRGRQWRWLLAGLAGVAWVGFVSNAAAQKAQMLSLFDLDASSEEFDGLVSVAPEGLESVRFESLSVAKVAVARTSASETLHLVSSAIEPLELSGKGKILFAAPTAGISAAYVGMGELPEVASVGGLTELALNQPTPYCFVAGERMFLYYITDSSGPIGSFGDIYGSGNRSVLTLVADSTPSPIAVPKNTDFSQTTRSKSKPEAELKHPLLAKIFQKSLNSAPSTKASPSRPFSRLRKKIEKKRTKPLFALVKANQKPQRNRSKRRIKPPTHSVPFLRFRVKP